MTSTDFTRERLERLLRTKGDIDWRHDVDFDPDCALKMAEFERRLGVQSTYYVMARSEFYNPFAPKTRQTFLEIHGKGHRLGLHVDLCLGRGARVTTPQMVGACLDDRALLSRVLPVTDAVSFHAPPRDVYWRDIPGFDHALSPAREGQYVADSRGVFRESPEKKIAAGPTQVNLHPEWWFWPDAVARPARVREAVAP